MSNKEKAWSEIWSKIPNRVIHCTARDYRQLANLLFDKLQSLNLVNPLFVNSSLAIELHLKCLNAWDVYHPIDTGGHQVTSKSVVGHSLVKLFDGLPAQIKAEIDSHFATRRPQLGGPRKALEPYANLFVEERYWFEYPDREQLPPINHLVDVMNLIGDYVDQLTPRQRSSLM